MRRGGKTIREHPATVREGGATVREGGATVRERPATVRDNGATVREHPATRRGGGATVREGPATVRDSGTTVWEHPATRREGGATVRERPAAARDSGATVREGGATVRDSGATVREGGATVRERPATRRENGTTVREHPATRRENGATVREHRAAARDGGATVREGPGAPPPSTDPSQQDHAFGWLPPSLAADWRVVEALPAQGAEADIYVVKSRQAALDAGGSTQQIQHVAKVYRKGVKPNEGVLARLRANAPPHVVRLVDYGQEVHGQYAGHWWELMEHAPDGSLSDLFKDEGPRLPNDLVHDILRQLNDGLVGLHELELEHKDLKPDNVLVRSRTPLDLVLSDFGISSVLDGSGAEHKTTTARTLRYAPPEATGSMVSDEDTRRSVVVFKPTTWDYWSLGMMLIEMLQGKHSYDGISEAAISHRLSVTNFDELTEELSDPSWRKLCRGLLRRDPEDRWDGAAVSKWLADPDDPSLAVAEDTAPARPSAEPSTPTIDFAGKSYRTPADLGAALSRDWAKANPFWKYRLEDVRTWVTDRLGRQSLGNALMEIDDADLSFDAQVFQFNCLLAPNAPPRFRDVDLSIEGLAALAERAIIDTDARTTFLALYREGILMQAGSLPGREELNAVWRRWNKTLADYGRIRSEMRARDVTVPEPDDDVLLRLLAAEVPSRPILATLRSQADRRSTADALQCRWFRELGTPEEMPIAVLPMLPHLQAPAEHGAKLARTAPLRAVVGGMVVGYLFGEHVYWAATGVGFGSEFGYHLEGLVSLAAVVFALAMAVMWYGRGTNGVSRWVRDMIERRRRRRGSRR